VLKLPSFFNNRAGAHFPQSNFSGLGCALDCSAPAEQKEVAATKRTAIRLQYPQKHSFEGVSGTHTAEIDRFAVWAPCRE